MINPLNRQIRVLSSRYGFRTHPTSGKVNSFHNGVDIPTYIRTPLFARAPGKVVVSRANRGNPATGYGYYMVIAYDGYCILYAHLDKLGLPVGTPVKEDDLIGYTGNTGNSTGPHLHMEIRVGKYDYNFFSKNADGRYLSSVDPETFVPPSRLEKWQQLIISKMDQPAEWLELIKHLTAAGQVNNTIAKFFPEFIEKLGGKDA